MLFTPKAEKTSFSWLLNIFPDFLDREKNFIDFREPKNRATWLKIWYKQIEKLEKENPWALAFNEEEEIDSKTLWQQEILYHIS